MQRLQLNSTSTVVSNYHESWHGVDVGGPTYQRLDRFLPLFLSPLPLIQAYRESWHGVKSPSCRVCPVPSAGTSTAVDLDRLSLPPSYYRLTT